MPDAACLESGSSADHPSLFLVVSYGAKLFAIAIGSVEEVVIPGLVNEVPGAGSELEGLMNLRGEALPVLNAAELFGHPARPCDGVNLVAAASHLVIVTSGRGRYGLTVDKALRVMPLAPLCMPTTDLLTLGAAAAVKTYAVDAQGQTILIVEPEILAKGRQP